MLIFVILSTTEAYFPKSSQPQPWPYPCHHHSRALHCRPPKPPRNSLCSPSLPSHPQSKPLCPPCPTVSYPIPPFCPVLCPPSPSVSCPLSCPLSPLLSSPSLPASSPSQHYNIRPISSNSGKLASYLDGISESHQGSYKTQQSGHLINDIETVTGLLHSSFSTKPEPTELLKNQNQPNSSQQFNQPFNTYLSSIIHENGSILSQQQLRQIATTEMDEPIAGIAKKAQKYGAKYLIKSNCSSNDRNCFIDDFTVPPENDCCTNCSAPCRFRYIRKTSLRSDQVQEVDPVCNNELLKQIIDKQVDDDINKSKIRIERTSRWFLGGLFGVICGNDNFAYVIQTKDFCQHRKGNVTCYVFRPLLDYSKINIP